MVDGIPTRCSSMLKRRAVFKVRPNQSPIHIKNHLGESHLGEKAEVLILYANWEG